MVFVISIWSFNSRPHTEVDICSSLFISFMLTFNSRPHTEVDRNNAFFAISHRLFQFTTSHGGRRCFLGCEGKPPCFQFTTSHGGRRIARVFKFSISIFQFTTSHGGRQDRKHICLVPHNLSIHDLTRRSTFSFRRIGAGTQPFNSRPHTEVDGIFLFITIFMLSFNSRPHTEVD